LREVMSGGRPRLVFLDGGSIDTIEALVEAIGPRLPRVIVAMPGVPLGHWRRENTPVLRTDTLDGLRREIREVLSRDPGGDLRPPPVSEPSVPRAAPIAEVDPDLMELIPDYL